MSQSLIVGREGFRLVAPIVHRVGFSEGGEGAVVCMREITSGELKSLQAKEGKRAEVGNMPFVYELLAVTVCDGAGSPLFRDAADLEASFDLPVRTLQRLANEALRVNGLGGEEKN